MVREPDKYAALPGEGVRLVAGDVTDRDSVARVAAGHDAAISAVYDAGAEPAAFFTSASQALLSGLPQGVWGGCWWSAWRRCCRTPPGWR